MGTAREKCFLFAPALASRLSPPQEHETHKALNLPSSLSTLERTPPPVTPSRPRHPGPSSKSRHEEAIEGSNSGPKIAASLCKGALTAGTTNPP